MKISVEISKYPLAEDYKPAIKDFIGRLQAHKDVNVVSNTISTQVFGEYVVVMDLLKTEMQRSYAEHGQAIFVCKFMQGDRSP